MVALRTGFQTVRAALQLSPSQTVSTTSTLLSARGGSFALFIEISRSYSFLFLGKGSTPALFRVILRQLHTREQSCTRSTLLSAGALFPSLTRNIGVWTDSVTRSSSERQRYGRGCERVREIMFFMQVDFPQIHRIRFCGVCSGSPQTSPQVILWGIAVGGTRRRGGQFFAEKNALVGARFCM